MIQTGWSAVIYSAHALGIKYAQLVNAFFHNSKTVLLYQKEKTCAFLLIWKEEKYRDCRPTVHKEYQVSNSLLSSPISMLRGLAKLIGGRAPSGYRHCDGVEMVSQSCCDGVPVML